ncbi:endonuclease NucS domain-containing protein, partial [Halarchaeum acidiphilum]|uniref:endonuclease NucS domain-containing protein n=1 Tax=Halarchaeum acidiphilum TaxID=489138 RepID=UPI00036B508C
MSDTARHALVDPALAEAAAFVRDARDRRAFCTLLGRCHLAYDGRTRSHAGPADRLVALKPDLTLLVHAADGPTPQNRLAADGVDIERDDEAVRLVATRESPDEELVVAFESIARASAMPVEKRDADVEVSGTEADLKERVLADPALVEDGFRALATERDTSAGPIDVFGRDRDGRPVAVELKKGRAGPDAASQLARYVDALERDLHADATSAASSSRPRAPRP